MPKIRIVQFNSASASCVLTMKESTMYPINAGRSGLTIDKSKVHVIEITKYDLYDLAKEINRRKMEKSIAFLVFIAQKYRKSPRLRAF